MKIDVSQLTQDKKNLGIIAALVAVVLAGALFMVLKGGGGGTEMAAGPDAAGTAADPNAPADPAAPQDPAGGVGAGLAPDAGGAPPPPDAGAAPPGGIAGPGSESGTQGGSGAPGGAPGFAKGPPVEPFRRDPFEPDLIRRPFERVPVMPPLVLAIQPPEPMVIPSTVNVIPASVSQRREDDVRSLQRRISGVLWNGKVVAILETPNDPQQRTHIVRPGDRIPSMEYFVKSISRDRMVLIDESTADRAEVVVDLKALPQGAAQGMAPGMMPGMEGMMPGMEGMMPGMGGATSGGAAPGMP